MDKIQIDGELDRSWIATLLSEGLNTYQILNTYDVTEKTIIESADLLDKEVLLQGFNFSEDFIRKALDFEYFTFEDLNELTMTTYSNLSDDFIEEYSDNLNWRKILIYLSTQTNNFDRYSEIIENKNLWTLISANNLPTTFVRQYKDKLDWNLLSMTKCFTEEEKQEFETYIVENKRELTDEELKAFGSFNVSTDYEKNYSVDEIADLIDKYMFDNNKDFYINIDNK